LVSDILVSDILVSDILVSDILPSRHKKNVYAPKLVDGVREEDGEDPRRELVEEGAGLGSI
jgi:hypothetical protein